MSEWPEIVEPELLERLAMDDAAFAEYTRSLIAAVGPREYDAELLSRALGYPWTRPQGSFQMTGEGIVGLAELPASERDRVERRFMSDEENRLPILAFGSNGSPEALKRKFGHFPDERDRDVLALTGRLSDFDVGVAPQPALYGAMPATLFPSEGTQVCATVLWVTPTQFTQLTWSELSYRLGWLRTPFEVDEDDTCFDQVLAFVSRFGAFCVEGLPVALAAVPAVGRTAEAMTQEELLDVAAALAIGPEATAETLVRAIFEDVGAIAPRIAETLHPAALPFSSERWTPFSPPAPA